MKWRFPKLSWLQQEDQIGEHKQKQQLAPGRKGEIMRVWER